MIRFVSAVACLAALTAPVRADEPAPAEPPLPVEPAPHEEQPTVVAPRARDITIEIPGERPRENKLLLAGLGAAAVLVSGLGVYWHLDSRDASDEVSSDELTGKAWTETQIALVDRADRSRTRAIVAYSLGGALLIGTIVTYIVTEPESTTTVIHTGVAIAPAEHGSGGMISKLWSF